MPGIEAIPDVKQTTEAKEMGNISHVNERLVTDGTNERRPEGYDQFSLSPESRKKYGIKDNEVHWWALDTQNTNWKNFTASDGVQEALDDNNGSRQIFHNGAPVRRRDVVLMVKPREEADAAQVRIDREAAELNRQINEQDLPGDFGKMTSTKEDRERIRDHNSIMLRQGGFIGPTQGLTLREASQGKTKADIEGEMARYRRAGRSVTIVPDEKPNTTNRKTFALGAGLQDGRVVR